MLSKCLLGTLEDGEPGAALEEDAEDEDAEGGEDEDEQVT